MNKLTLAVASAGLITSLGAYAALPTGAEPFQIVVPNLDHGLELFVDGLYLQPSNSDLNYLTVTPTPTSSTAPVNSNVSTANPDYGFGFRVGLGYIFPNSGNDVQLSWTHFDNNSTDSTGLGNGGTALSRSGWMFPVLPSSEGLVTGEASSTTTFKNDAVDLDIGQYISMGTRLEARLFGGLRFAQVTNDINNYYNEDFTPSGYPTFYSINGTLWENYYSKFTGIGPRFGINATYHIANCFGVVAQFGGSLLVGRMEASSNGLGTSGFTYGNQIAEFKGTSTFNTPNQTRVVPEFDGKLGVNYSVQFMKNPSTFTIEAGYQATEYLDAVDRISPVWANDGFSSVPANLLGVTRTTSNVSFAGPYVSLQLKV